MSSLDILENTRQYLSFETRYRDILLPLLVLPIGVNKLQSDSSLHIEYTDDKSGEKKKIKLPFNYQKPVKSECNRLLFENQHSGIKQEACALRLYASDKIAVIELNDFKNNMPLEEYRAKIKEYMNSIISLNIQHLFIDITAKAVEVGYGD